MGNLTALKIKGLKEPGRYNDGRGLMLYVKPSGSRTWVLRTQANGARRDFGLGRADDVSLAEARELADALRKNVRNGADPVAQKRSAKMASSGMPTFKQAAIAAHNEQIGSWRNPKHQAQWMSSLEAYAFPIIGDVGVDKVEGPAIRDLLAEIWLAKPETARRVRQRIGAVLDWAYAKGYREAEAPMRSVSKGLPRQPKRDSHFAALPYEQIPGLMTKLGKEDSVGRNALRFLILTAARSGEIRMAIWREIDFATKCWTIPGERMKAGKTHIVPLTDECLCILDQMKGAFGAEQDKPIFPGQTGRAMSDATLSKVLRVAIGADWTVHGLRSSFRDWAAEQTSFPGEVAEKALAHAIPSKVEASYRRTIFLEKRRDMMAEWAAFALGGERSKNAANA